MQIWLDIAKSFPNIIPKDKEISFIDEIDSFSLVCKTGCQEHSYSGLSIIKRWQILSNDSTSQVESVFSEFKALKTSYRNRLSVYNLEASVLAEQHFRSSPLKILPEMIQRYFHPNKKEEKVKMEAQNEKSLTNSTSLLNNDSNVPSQANNLQFFISS